MRTLFLALILAVLLTAASVVKGGVSFELISSVDEVNGTFLLYIYQPLCGECKVLEELFKDGEVAQALSQYRLYALDLSASPVAAVEVYVGGQVAYVDHGVVRYYAANGTKRLYIPGTPTVLIGVREGDRIRLLGFWTGADVPQGVDLKKTFLQFLRSGEEGGESSPIYVIPWAAALALGVASVFSPCVLPVVALAASTHFSRRSLWRVLAGLVCSYAAFGAAVGALGLAAEGARRAVAVAGGAALGFLGLVLSVDRLNVKYASAMSRVQSSVFKRARSAGDFLLGASLGAVWMPCILPYAGLATVVALASLAGDFFALFTALLLYGVGLAAAVYAVVKVVGRYVKPGRAVEKAVGALSIAVGIYLLWAAV